MNSFAPCPACQRHVRVADPTCPFCGAAADGPRVARVPTLTTERVGRAGIMLLGLSLAACGGDTQSNVAMYGAPPAEPSAGGGGTATTTTTTTATTPTTESTPNAGAAVDAGTTTSGPPNDNGAIVAMYGVAIFVADAGSPDAQPPPAAHHGHHGATHNAAPSEPTVAPLYGVPPSVTNGH